EQRKAVPCLAAQGPETGIGLGEGLLSCAKKSETYFLFDESELAHEDGISYDAFSAIMPAFSRTSPLIW
ncbi:hypothetical protein, partial [Pseudomonas syringae]|uniref:hypothetical protein n=2 Tax=Pseudomonas syringae TaxID=317 RepID=UPI001E30413A